jgi:large subunit ribosomal protein L21
MYAIIETGGKQYRVEEGDLIDVEIDAGGEPGEEVVFERVLFVGGAEGAAKPGDPVVAGAKVAGSLVAAVRGPKIKVFKKKRRKGYKRLRGHRQELHRVRIGEIRV